MRNFGVVKHLQAPVGYWATELQEPVGIVQYGSVKSYVFKHKDQYVFAANVSCEDTFGGVWYWSSVPPENIPKKYKWLMFRSLR